MRRRNDVDAIDFLMIAIAWVTACIFFGLVARSVYELVMVGWRLIS